MVSVFLPILTDCTDLVRCGLLGNVCRCCGSLWAVVDRRCGLLQLVLCSSYAVLGAINLNDEYNKGKITFSFKCIKALINYKRKSNKIN